MAETKFAVIGVGGKRKLCAAKCRRPDFRDNAMYFGELLQYVHFAASFGSFAFRKVTPTGQRMHSDAPTD